jgi:hypothetical protein
VEDSILKLALAEILNGYSPIYSEKFGQIFVKHFSNLDNSFVDQEYNKYYQLALQNNLSTLEQREKEIEEEGLWTKENVVKLRESEKILPTLKITKSKLFREIDVKSIQNQIDQTESEISKLKFIKNALIGITAESFANKKSNEFFIYQSLFDDQNLVKRKFSEDEYNELDPAEIHELVDIYNSSKDKFNEKNIKKIAFSPQFSNAFYLCNDDPYSFYGKPVIKLTLYQIDIFANAKYFKSIIQNSSKAVPQEVLTDPDRLVDWFNATKTADQLISDAEKNLAKSGKESGGGGISIVGASSSDLKKIGIESDGNNNLMKMAMAKGGSLNFEDIIRAQGG